jgi:hypothetical protein
LDGQARRDALEKLHSDDFNVRRNEGLKGGATVKRVIDKSNEKIDGEYVYFLPLLLKSFDSESDMEGLIQLLDAAGCAYTVI